MGYFPSVPRFPYDPFGNISKSGSASWLPNYNNSQNQYLQGWNGVAYDPGGNGNLLNDTFNSYTWDVYGDMASANGVTATYDAFGRMVELANGPQRALAQLVYSPADGSVLAETSAQGLVQAFAQLPGGGYALYVSSSNVYYYSHPDWLGSTRLLSTPSRGPIPTMAYAPFGEGYAGGLAGYVTFTSGGYAFTVNPGENQGSGLDDFMFRRYSPGQSRWISPDPAGLAAVDPSNPQTWNRYAYVGNNPLSRTDPLGLYYCACEFDDGGGGGGGDPSGGDPCFLYGMDCGGQGPSGPPSLPGGGGVGLRPCLAGAGPLLPGQSRCAANNGVANTIRQLQNCNNPSAQSAGNDLARMQANGQIQITPSSSPYAGNTTSPPGAMLGLQTPVIQINSDYAGEPTTLIHEWVHKTQQYGNPLGFMAVGFNKIWASFTSDGEGPLDTSAQAVAQKMVSVCNIQ